jgi:BlaI family penicillinase repressor
MSHSERKPRISDAEWSVMQVLWTLEQATARDVVEVLARETKRETHWSDRTVKTLLARLVKKGALGFEDEGKRYLYHPLLSRDACVQVESDSFVERVLGGSVSPLLASFVRRGKLTEDEIRELRELLDRASDGRSQAESDA